MADQKLDPFTQHYLEIAALEPVTATTEPPPPTVNPGVVVTWPLIIFFGLFITGFLVLFFKRLHQFRSVLMVFVVAFLLAMLPLAMRSTERSSQIGTKADVAITPTNLIISSVTSIGFTIEWDTAAETAGAVKISRTQDMLDEVFTYPDDSLLTHHRLVISALDPGSTYFLQVLSDTTWFENDGEPIKVTLPSS